MVYLLQFDPNAISDSTKPLASFSLPSSVTTLTPYEYCNLHGLWKGPTVTVPFSVRAQARESAVDPQSSSGPTSSHTASTPAIKHDPAVTTIVRNADGSHTVTVVVRGTDGSLSNLHPNDNGHWIETIYVKDQDGTVIFMEEFPEPTSGTSAELGTYPPASIFFTLEADTTVTSLTPYEYCNLHGLWQGPTVPMAATSTGGTSIQSGLSFGVVFGTLLAIAAGAGILPDLMVMAYATYGKEALLPSNVSEHASSALLIL